VTGAAEIVWAPDRVSRYPGAERLVRVEVEAVIQTTHRLTAPFPVVEYSRFNPPAASARR